MTVHLSESELVAIRAAHAGEPAARFVDPHQVCQVQNLLRRRGEPWAAAVLGRSLARRSLISDRWPWLAGHEVSVLLDADIADDAAACAAMGEPTEELTP